MTTQNKPLIPPPPVETRLQQPPSLEAANSGTSEHTSTVGQREEIREVTHRVMGSRQSERKIERSGSHRQPKRGPGSQR